MNTITEKIEKQGGILATSELKGQAEYKRLLRAANRGDIMRLRRGIYADPATIVNAMTDVERIIPRGIVCMYTAWSHYQLTTTIPYAFCVAIDAKRKVTKPDNIPFNLFYWKRENLQFGIVEQEICGYHVRITDLERSVCDAIKYRNKIGLDLCAEIVRNYLKRNDKNLTRLIEYGDKLRISKIINNYLEMMTE